MHSTLFAFALTGLISHRGLTHRALPYADADALTGLFGCRMFNHRAAPCAVACALSDTMVKNKYFFKFLLFCFNFAPTKRRLQLILYTEVYLVRSDFSSAFFCSAKRPKEGLVSSLPEVYHPHL